ncbi:MAG: cation:proton antiporter [Tepidisphaeraceae bacterium]
MRFTAVALFMGAAMSITAFPVLARILTERGLLKTKVGAIAITCAAVDDVSAWCMLAFVVAVGRAEGLVPGLTTAGLSGAYVLLMFFGVRPQLKRLETLYERHGSSAQTVFAIVLVLTMLSAAVTELIGIHAMFGAFLMGAIMPKEAKFVRIITGRLEDFTVIFLLPIFFAFAGLKTQIGLIDSPYLWGLTALIVLVACIGKFGGSAIAARAAGLDWRESSAIGILMNTRGLVELVILTIGLQIGVITDAVFAMMVIMALVTTAMTTPILHWVYPQRLFDATPVDEETAATEFGVLVPVSRPESAPNLANIVAALGQPDGNSKLYGVTLHRPDRDEALGVRVYEDEHVRDAALQPLKNAAAEANLRTELMSFASRDIPSDIGHIARTKRTDLILMGFHKPVIGKTMLGGTVHRVLTGADTDVAIFVDRGLPPTLSILVPYQGSPHDKLAVALASRMARAKGASVTILHVVKPGAKRAETTKKTFPDSVQVWVVEDASPVDAALRQSGDFNLMIVGLSEEWGLTSQLFGMRAERIADEWHGSLLLVRKYAAILPEAITVSDANPAAPSSSPAPKADDLTTTEIASHD